MNALLHYDMATAAQTAVEENLRMDADTLFDLLGRWFPEATDAEVAQVVEETL